MIEATSCGGVVIFRGKILLLYKNYKNKYEGWVLPKGTVEPGEDYKDTAVREVKEETGASATIIRYIGKSQYSFTVPEDTVDKEVHWYFHTDATVSISGNTATLTKNGKTITMTFNAGQNSGSLSLVPATRFKSTTKVTDTDNSPVQKLDFKMTNASGAVNVKITIAG